MPFYEYECTQCGHEEEVLQKISDAPLRKCAVCNHSTMKKKISAAAFRLKGGGWYETDFKSGNKKNLHTDAKVNKKETRKMGDKAKPASNKTKADSTKAKKAKT